MLKVLRRGARSLEEVVPDPDWSLPDDVLWLDLIRPGRDEEQAVERELGIDIPTREEMAEIEPSSRLYQEGGATFVTAALLTHATTDFPIISPITFILAGERLVTIRYVEPTAFKAYAGTFERQPCQAKSGGQVFVDLLDAVVDRIADILELVSAEVETASQSIFKREKRGGFEQALSELGRAQMVSAKARASLASLARVISFAALADELESVPNLREHTRSLQRDVQSLTDHAAYISGNITFLLDAALGLINIEQNAIIKIFSVAAVAFLPPTLVASIYGMNFRHMPELTWPWGYPIAICVMVASAAVPLWWFRRKGWL